MSFNAPSTTAPHPGSLVYSPLSQFISSWGKAMRQIQSISHSLQDAVAIQTIKDFCHIKHGRERRGRSQTMTLESRLNQTALYQWWELRKPPIPQIKMWKHWWSSSMRWCLPLEASCLICHFSNDLSKEDPRFAFLAPAPIMEKRYSGAYFTGPVKPTHAPLQSTQELHSIAARFHGRAVKLTMTKLANLDCLDTISR